MAHNYLNLKGIEFVEYASIQPQKLEKLWLEFGFSKTQKHFQKNVDLYEQNDIHFLVNAEAHTHAAQFTEKHGPCISAMGWRVENASDALKTALERGARAAQGDYFTRDGQAVPAIYGIGDSLIYFVDQPSSKFYSNIGFEAHPHPVQITDKGFTAIDHLTNNVAKGEMSKWATFYKEIFGFEEVRYFDIRGAKTGLTSYALRSPCGTFCIPINEGTDSKSQIDEYLREYKGPGVQHLAFLTNDILGSLKKLEGSSIETLDIDDEYYASVFDRVPNVKESHEEIRKYDVLVDGDDEGYLLQIFTKNIIGPIFIEIIQRHNHLSFGEGNFGALFRSIERDQEKRGVL